jgi:hypothetical protein
MSQIVIDTTKLRKKALRILKKLDNFYLKLNQELSLFWRRIIPTDQDGLLGWFFRFVRRLLDHPATALFVNTVALSAVGTIFGAFFSEQVNLWIKGFVGLNIFVFCARVLGWQNKLKK